MDISQRTKRKRETLACKAQAAAVRELLRWRLGMLKCAGVALPRRQGERITSKRKIPRPRGSRAGDFRVVAAD